MKTFMEMAVMVVVMLVALYWLHLAVQRRIWAARWSRCLDEARAIVAGVKLQYPGCEGAMNAITPPTLDTSLSQASSAYRNLQREDLMDVLDLFQPAATPLYTLAKNGPKLDDFVTWWEVDKYDVPQGATGPGDGYPLQTFETTDVTSTVRKMANGVQQFRKGYGSGWLAERIPNRPGVGKGNLAAALKKYTIELKQNVEVSFSAFDLTYNTDQGGANGPTMAGLRKMIDPANSYASANAAVPGAPSDIHFAPAGACVTGALVDVFNLSLIKTMLSALFDNVQMDREYWLICGKGLRQAVSAITNPEAIGGGVANSTPAQQRIYTREQDDETFKQKISIIQTDFGTLKVKLAPIIGTVTGDVNGNFPAATRAARVYTSQPNYGYIVPEEKLQKRMGWPIDVDELGHDGSGVVRQIFTAGTLAVLNPQGFGFLALT